MAYLTAEKKQELFGQYGKSNTDTGSPESQIALFSYRISHLTEHLKSNKHDFGTQRKKWRQFPRGVAFIFVAKNNSKTL